MHKPILFIYFCIIFSSFSQTIIPPHQGPLIPYEVPEFHLDLDIEPYHRWDHIIPVYKEALKTFNTYFVDKLELSDETLEKIGIYYEEMYQYQDLVQEMKGIANIADIPWQKIAVQNLVYEYSTFVDIPMCSSILVKDKFNKIIHSRNLDYDWMRKLAQIIGRIKVYKGDRYVGQWDQIIGNVDVLTGYNPGKFSVTINDRFYTDDEDLYILLDNIFVQGYIGSTTLVRKVLEEELSYQEAKEKLTNTEITAPIYFVISSETEGCDIAREPWYPAEIHEINENSDAWYIVQANADWNNDPWFDNRRVPMEKKLDKVGQENINAEKLWELTTEYPTLNWYTIYTVLFSTEYDHNQISLWFENVYGDSQDINFDGLLKESKQIEFIKDILENTDYLDSKINDYRQIVQ